MEKGDGEDEVAAVVELESGRVVDTEIECFLCL